MKKATIKKVNASLPRVDYLRSMYRMSDQCGQTSAVYTYQTAYADLYEDGRVGVYVYGYGEAMPSRHFYCSEDTWCIASIIEDFIRGKISRHDCCELIKYTINGDIPEDEE